MQRVLLLCVAVLLCVSAVFAQQEAAGPVIVATGTAPVTVPADSLKYGVRVSVRRAPGENQDEAISKVERAAGEVRQALLGLNIEGLQVGISRPDHGEGADADVTAALAGVQDHGLFQGHAGRIWRILLQDRPGVLVGGPGGCCLKWASAQAEADGARQAIPGALKQAKANAEALAAAAGVKIGGYESISGSWVSYCSKEGASAGGAGAAWQRLMNDAGSGSLLVVYTVTVTGTP